MSWSQLRLTSEEVMKTATPKKAEGATPAKKVVRRIPAKAGLSKSTTGSAAPIPILKKDGNSKAITSQAKLAGPKPEEAEIPVGSKTDAVPDNPKVNSKLEGAGDEVIDKNVAIGTKDILLSETGEKPKTKRVVIKKRVILVKKSSASAVSSASQSTDCVNQVKMGEKSESEATREHVITTGMPVENPALKEEKPKTLALGKPQRVVVKRVIKGKGSIPGSKEDKKQGFEVTVEKNDLEASSAQKTDAAIKCDTSKSVTQEAFLEKEDIQEVEADRVDECEAVITAAEELQCDNNHEFEEEPEYEEDVGGEQGVGAETAPGRPVSERQKRKKLEVFVGGLDKDATEDDVRATFKPVGDVMEVRLMMNPVTGKNKGYAFVRFATAEQAGRAATEFSAIQIRGKECGVLPNQDNDTLFIGNISRDWKSSEVLQKLNEYGVNGIEELTLIGDPQNEALNRGYAFLELATHYDAVNAFQRLQRPGVTFGYDRPAKVSWAQPLNEADASTMSQVKSVFVDGLPPSWTEDMVKQSFGRFGEIERIVLARNMPFAKRKDFAFVNFSSRENALACVEACSNTDLSDGDKKVKVKVSLTRPLQKGRTDKWSTVRYGGHSGRGRGRLGRGEGWFSTRFGSRGTGFGRNGGRGMVGRGGKRLYDEDEVRMLLKAAREEEGWASTTRGRGGRFGQAPRGMTRGDYAQNDESIFYDAGQTESFRHQDEAIHTHDAYSRPPSDIATSRGKASRPDPTRDDYESHHLASTRARLSQHTEHYSSPRHEYHPRYEQGVVYGPDEGVYVGAAQDYNQLGGGMKRQASAWDEDVYESSHRGYPRARVDYSEHMEIASHYSSHVRSPAGLVAQTSGLRQGRSTREGPMPLYYDSGSGLGKAAPVYNDPSYTTMPLEASTFSSEVSERRETSVYPSSMYGGGHGGSVGYDLHTSGYY